MNIVELDEYINSYMFYFLFYLILYFYLACQYPNKKTKQNYSKTSLNFKTT
jgi:hypothetical protein